MHLSSTHLYRTRLTFNQDGHNFHVLSDDGLAFLVMASCDAGMVKPFLFLDDVARAFKQKYPTGVDSAVAYELSDFSKVLEERMSFYSLNSSDPVTRVKGQLDEVKGVMIQNLEKVLARGEKLELLVEKTESLQNVAFNFRREGRVLHRAFAWRNVQMYVVLAFAGLASLYLILGIFCGFKLSKC